MTPDQLAETVRAWRAEARLSAAEAAARLEIPAPTLRNVEYGRGFPYPKLLLAAIEAERRAAAMAAAYNRLQARTRARQSRDGAARP